MSIKGNEGQYRKFGMGYIITDDCFRYLLWIFSIQPLKSVSDATHFQSASHLLPLIWYSGKPGKTAAPE
jgi:hypothetical protein